MRSYYCHYFISMEFFSDPFSAAGPMYPVSASLSSYPPFSPSYASSFRKYYGLLNPLPSLPRPLLLCLRQIPHSRPPHLLYPLPIFHCRFPRFCREVPRSARFFPMLFSVFSAPDTGPPCDTASYPGAESGICAGQYP